MATDFKERQAIGQSLAQARNKHQKLLDKVEKARRKYNRRAADLQDLEQQIVRLQPGNGDGPGARTGKPARLIYNPGSGRNSNNPNSLEELVRLLRVHGIEPRLGIKTSGKAAREMAKEAAENGEELVIVAGGDGTIEDVASQLVGTKTALAILPVGTMNNLARSLGIPMGLEPACALAAVGLTRRIDVGHVVANVKKQKRFFLETAGVGLTAIAFPAGQAAKKGRFDGLPDYLRELVDSKPMPTQIELDWGESFLANTQLVTVSNAPLIGLNFMIAPAAKMDDGLLDIAVYDEMSKGEILSYFVAIANGKPAENAKIRRYRARRLHIHSPHGEPIHSDKDEIDERKDWEIEVLPQALSVVVGPDAALNVEAPEAVVSSQPSLIPSQTAG